MNAHFVHFPLHLFLGLLAADFFAGFIHWAEDTYATYQWPAVLRRWIVLDNIAHHQTPARFTRGTWLYRNQVPMFFGAGIALLIVAAGVRSWQPYWIIGICSVSNEVHAWAHRKNVPRLVALLQRVGIFQSRSHHGVHHRSPYAVRFCTTTNFLNPVLDGLRFWRILEVTVALVFGVTPKRVTEARGGF